ncbi:hypothetical protein VTK56DRAFT_5050 [Thermocarpiscus australiensis]
MGRPPAYLFVVRHGNRLDAADKQWHLSSPTPYDPPLTYSGWQQAKSVGVKIASIIRERVKEDELAACQNGDPSAKRKRKRYEVVLHSSPFLRCIQTAIAISAGLAQDSAPFEPTNCASGSTQPSAQGTRSRPTVVTDMRNTGSPAPGPDKPVGIRRSVLRLDAFLGEWLSPTYFELITPPPESVMMLASAKADLLRREDYTHYPSFSVHAHSNSQGQLWSPIARSSPVSLPNDGQSNRSGNLSSSTSSSPGSVSVSSQNNETSRSQRPEVTGYVSPVPHYAVSNNNTIPPGYVSHARDACVDVDYQWDSTRSPLDWGDGGTFPEEWIDMHKRLRAGIQSLVEWYSTAEHPTRPVSKTAARGSGQKSADPTLNGEDDVETEAVVVLVSHGAGCNALIGAITHQPVLADVAMASLTMAVYNPSTENAEIGKHPNPCPSGSSRHIPPVHELYDLKLFASTDHLRSPPQTPNSSRSPAVASMLSSVRGRHSSFSSPQNGSPWSDRSGSRGSSANAALSSLRAAPPAPRPAFTLNTGGITVGSGVTSFSRPSNVGRTPMLGLWSPTSSRDEEDDEDNMLLNFSHERPAASTNSPKVHNGSAPLPSELCSNGNNMESQRSNDLGGLTKGISSLSAEPLPRPQPGQLGAGPGGLWGGGPRPPDEADRLRDHSASKRRWTVTERS